MEEKERDRGSSGNGDRAEIIKFASDSKVFDGRQLKNMKKLVLGPISILAVLLLIPAGHATSLVPISGGFVTTVNSQTVNQFGTILIISEHFSLAFTGSLVGTTAGKATIVVNLNTGNGVFFGTQTFTGTFLTSSGTLLMTFSATFAGTSFQGTFAAYGGTAGLTNVVGHGTITGTVNVSGSYSGQLTSPA